LSNAIVVLGGGGGIACVLRALRGENCRLTAIVGLASGPRSEPDDPAAGETVQDLRRSLEALAGNEGPLLRAIRRPLSVDKAGTHPLGNFVIASLARGLGDHRAASCWLGRHLEVRGHVLPATAQPVRRVIENGDEGAGPAAARRLRFEGECLQAPPEAIEAIRDARWALLAPGALYRSVLSAAAAPDVARALRRTRAQVVWIANLEPDPPETGAISPLEHVLALPRHGVRVDAVLHDPAATLALETDDLTRQSMLSIRRAMCDPGDRAVHDPERLRAALRELIAPSATSRGFG
jgi:uncharacterized cofD-like protein